MLFINPYLRKHNIAFTLASRSGEHKLSDKEDKNQEIFVLASVMCPQ